MSETHNENRFDTVEITILFPPWIRSYLSDILFCLGNNAILYVPLIQSDTILDEHSHIQLLPAVTVVRMISEEAERTRSD